MQKATCFLFIILLVVTCKRPDVSEQGQFTIIGTCALPGYSTDIDVQGSYAYVANDQGGLQILDISIRDSIFVIGAYTSEKSIVGVAVRDTFAFCAIAHAQGGMRILNISDNTAPIYVGEDNWYRGYNVTAPDEDSIYVYVAGGYWFIVEDVHDPEYPTFVRRFSTPGDVRSVYIRDSLAFCACEQMGIYIFNLAKPDSEAMIGWIDTPSNARAVYVSNDYMYIADGRGGLAIIDIINPENPVSISFSDTPEYANDVIVEGNYAYIADGEGGLQIIDVSNPEDPILYANVETSYANAVYVRDGLVYVADRDMGLVIIEEEE